MRSLGASSHLGTYSIFIMIRPAIASFPFRQYMNRSKKFSNNEVPNNTPMNIPQMVAPNELRVIPYITHCLSPLSLPTPTTR